MDQERIAYHNQKGPANIADIKLKYNQAIKSEAWEKYNLSDNLDRLQYYKNIFMVNNYLIGDQWQILTMFPTSQIAQ